MKTIVAALAAAAILAGPALAQEIETYTEQEVIDATAAIEAAELSDALHQNFWCGAAFLIINQLLASRGMADDATQAEAMADALFGKAATEAIELGVSEADFTAMAQNFRIYAISQTGDGPEADYTQEECTAAAQAQ